MGAGLKVKLAPSVVSFVSCLPPEPRRHLREGLRGLAHGRGDLKALQGDFEGFHRLRVGQYRVIFKHLASESGPRYDCFLVESRDVVYEMLATILAEEGRL